MNDLKLVNIGFGNSLMVNRMIAVISPESAPVKRLIQDARENARLIDATYGRRTRAVIIMDSGHVILSSVQPETVANRVSKGGAVLPEITEPADDPPQPVSKRGRNGNNE